MASEINFNPSLSAAVAMQGAVGDGQQGVQQDKQLQPLLGGENVKVSSGAMSDLEKLVARLRSEDENTRTDLTRMKLTAVMTALDTANVRLTNMQAAAFADMVEQEASKAEMEAELAQLYAEYGIGPNDDASLVMEMKIKSLEQAVARAVQEGKDHNEAVEKEKAKREEELAKAKADATRISALKSGIETANVNIAADIAALGPGKLNEIATALSKVAEGSEAPEERKSDAELQKEEEKQIAFDPLVAIREALDKIDEAIMRTIDENQMIKA